MHWEVVGAADGTYEVRETGARISTIIDGSPLSGLTIEAAGAYLYALSVIDGVELVERDLVTREVLERAVWSNGFANSVRMDSLLSTILVERQGAAPNLDILRALIRKIASENGIALVE